MSFHPLRNPLLLFGLVLVGGCSSAPVVPDSAPADGPLGEIAALDEDDPTSLELGAWADYPPLEEEEWAVSPLSVTRWATASAELACAGRAFQGDPKRQRVASDRILQHHATTAAEVMEFGIGLNGHPQRAQQLGELVAGAAERCQ